ncbi:MAG: uracil-DNA glycosylase [Verrucomicrobiota bacterium]
MSQRIEPRIEAGWKARLADEFNTVSFSQLKAFLLAERQAGKVLYPPGSKIFAAFDHTPWDRLKVVIVGQDPYHGPGQANGLCFSVNPGVQPPPSLVNIFKELSSDLDCPIPRHGGLSHWAREGVLLLNATLTVEARRAGSHQDKGWEAFTQAVIEKVVAEKDHVVFILWGKYAQAKEAVIDTTRQRVIKSPHPSPFSADRGFFGSKPFSRTNAILSDWGLEPVDWVIPDE